MSEDEAKKRIGLVKGTTDFEDGVKNADMVIEAVFEEMALKKKIFADLDKSPSPARSWPPTPRRSTSTRSPRRPAVPGTCSACTSSRPPTS